MAIPIPSRLDNYQCYLAILCTYIETQNLDITEVRLQQYIMGCLWIVAEKFYAMLGLVAALASSSIADASS